MITEMKKVFQFKPQESVIRFIQAKRSLHFFENAKDVIPHCLESTLIIKLKMDYRIELI